MANQRRTWRAQAFLHYLVSQKGGLTFVDGKVSGGDGLSALADLVRTLRRRAR